MSNSTIGSNRGSILADTLGITGKQVPVYQLRQNDIFTYNNKQYSFDRRVRGGQAIVATEVATGQGWKLRLTDHSVVTVSGKVEQYKVLPKVGELFIWVGKQGENLVYQFIGLDNKGNIKAKNPRDNKNWTLHKQTAYGPLEDFLSGKMKTI